MTKNSINNTSSDLQVLAINIAGSTISTTTTNTNLNLSPNGTGKVSISGAYTLPSADGTSGQFLQTNGIGNLSFANTTSYSSLNVQVFLSSGTYTAPSNLSFAYIEVIGGGGGGGGKLATTAGTMSGSAGGLSGSYSAGLFSAVTIGASQVVTIGAGGNGGNGTIPIEGTSGGTSSFGSLINATGGDHTINGSLRSNNLLVTPSSATIGTGGSLNLPNAASSYCFGLGNSPIFAIKSGCGGTSYYGGGGQGRVIVSSNSIAGTDGTGYGAGGSGAVGASVGVGAGFNGGNGASGVVIITEYLL